MGRPLGSKNKLRFKDNITNKEMDRLVALAVKRCETDSSILKFVLEQIYGRAAQPLSNSDNEPFKLKVMRSTDVELPKIDATTIMPELPYTGDQLNTTTNGNENNKTTSLPG